MLRHIELENLVSPVITGLGYLFEGLEFTPQGKVSSLRVYMDKEGGLNADDCQIVSRQLSAVLTVEAMIKGPYALEVSSPGLDRLLFSATQLRNHIGKYLAIKLNKTIANRQTYTGTLQSMLDDTQLTLAVGEETLILLLTDIEQVRGVPRW